MSAFRDPFSLGYSCLRFFQRQAVAGFARFFFFFCLLSLASQVVQILCRLNGRAEGRRL